MTVDNEIYERDAELWWTENSHLALLKGMIPARLEYLRNIAARHFQNRLRHKTVLDIGCGGGLFAEVLASLGCQVFGIDPSVRSIETARQHAAHRGLSVKYYTGSGEKLPFENSSFDMVCCCDVLEHVNDVNKVVAESVRVLKSAGIYFYDTINRTWMSKFFIVKLFQQWQRLGIMPANTHCWQQFVKPGELKKIMAAYHLESRGITGLNPGMNPVISLKRLRIMRRLKRGDATYMELARNMIFRPARLKLMNYMGYAVKIF